MISYYVELNLKLHLINIKSINQLKLKYIGVI